MTEKDKELEQMMDAVERIFGEDKLPKAWRTYMELDFPERLALLSKILFSLKYALDSGIEDFDPDGAFEDGNFSDEAEQQYSDYVETWLERFDLSDGCSHYTHTVEIGKLADALLEAAPSLEVRARLYKQRQGDTNENG